MGDYLSAAQDARGNWAAARRSDILTGAADKAENTANATGNFTQALKTRATSLLNNSKLTAGMSDDELQGLKDVQAGSPTVKAAEAVRKFTGSQGGNLFESGLAGLEAAQHFGPIGGMAAVASPWIANKVATGVSNAGSRSAMERLASSLRTRSPLFDQMVASGQSAPINTAAAKLAGAMTERGVSPILPAIRQINPSSVFTNPPGWQ
jgi:hypothetical protein